MELEYRIRIPSHIFAGFMAADTEGFYRDSHACWKISFDGCTFHGNEVYWAAEHPLAAAAVSAGLVAIETGNHIMVSLVPGQFHGIGVTVGVVPGPAHRVMVTVAGTELGKDIGDITVG